MNSKQRKDSHDLILIKSFYVRIVIAQERFDVGGAAVSATDPNYLWRKTKKDTQIAEVSVFCYDHKLLASCVLAHLCVRSSINANGMDMAGAWVEGHPGVGPVLARGFGQREVSPFNYHKPLFAIRSVAKAGEDVFPSEIGEVFKDLFLSHARREIFKHVVNCNPHTANARLATTFTGLDRDDVQVTHKSILEL